MSLYYTYYLALILNRWVVGMGRHETSYLSYSISDYDVLRQKPLGDGSCDLGTNWSFDRLNMQLLINGIDT